MSAWASRWSTRASRSRAEERGIIDTLRYAAYSWACLTMGRHRRPRICSFSTPNPSRRPRAASGEFRPDLRRVQATRGRHLLSRPGPGGVPAVRAAHSDRPTGAAAALAHAGGTLRRRRGAGRMHAVRTGRDRAQRRDRPDRDPGGLDGRQGDPPRFVRTRRTSAADPRGHPDLLRDHHQLHPGHSLPGRKESAAAWQQQQAQTKAAPAEAPPAHRLPADSCSTF